MDQLQTLVSRFETKECKGLDQSIIKVLESATELGWSCLHFACAKGNAELVEWMVANEANVNGETLDGWTPLALAAANNHPDCKVYSGIHYLSSSPYLEISHVSAVRGTALHQAAVSSSKESVQALLTLGADMTIEDGRGRIPLELALDRSIAEILPKAMGLRILDSVCASPEILSLINSSEEMETPPPFSSYLHFSDHKLDRQIYLVLDPENATLRRFRHKDLFYDSGEPEAELEMRDILNIIQINGLKSALIIMHKSGRDKYLSDFPEIISEWLKQIQYSIQLDKKRTVSTKRKFAICTGKNMITRNRSFQECTTPSTTSAENEPGIDDFEALDVLGAGTFGKVYKVMKKDTGEIFAMKVMKKKMLIEKKQLKHARSEAKIQEMLSCPFIVKLHYKFQTPRNIYFILDYCPNGDLGHQLSEVKSLSEDKVRFYMAEVLLALSYLHARGIIYRDMKPENLMLDEEGHIRLTDFGLAKEGITDSRLAKTFCGSLVYLAPEMLNRKGVNKPADVYGAATVMYELLTGEPPHYSQDMPTLLRKIKQGKLSFPWRMSSEAKDLLSAALAIDPAKRPGVEEMKKHPFFQSIDWEKMAARAIPPPKTQEKPAIGAKGVLIKDSNYSRNTSMEECLLHF